MLRATAILLLLTISATLHGQEAPNTRRWLVETAQWLEQNPLDPEARAKTRDLMQFWTEARFPVCPLLFETRNLPVARIVIGQAIVSAGAYYVEHRDATRAEYSRAGLEGALRAYRNAVAADETMRDKFLDGLLADRVRDRYLTKAVAKCEKPARR